MLEQSKSSNSPETSRLEGRLEGPAFWTGPDLRVALQIFATRTLRENPNEDALHCVRVFSEGDIEKIRAIEQLKNI